MMFIKRKIITIILMTVMIVSALLLVSCQGVGNSNDGIEGVWYQAEEIPENHTMEFFSDGTCKAVDIDYDGERIESKGKYTTEDGMVYISYENQYGEMEEPTEYYIVDYHDVKSLQTDSFIYNERDGSETNCILITFCSTPDAARKAYEENMNSGGREYIYIKPKEYKVKGIKEPVMPHDFMVDPDGITKVAVIDQKELDAEEFALDYYNKCIKPYHPTIHYVCNCGDNTATWITELDGKIEVMVFPFEKGDEYSYDTMGEEEYYKLFYIDPKTGKIRYED